MSEQSGRPGPSSLGVDIGAAGVKVALCSADGSVLQRAGAPNCGDPAAALHSALQTLAIETSDSLRIAATGSGVSRIGEALHHRVVNEVLATALAVHHRFPATRTVIDLGGQFSKWILLGPEGAVQDFASNGLCAAGAGAFLEQQAGRLGLTLDERGH